MFYILSRHFVHGFGPFINTESFNSLELLVFEKFGFWCATSPNCMLSVLLIRLKWRECRLKQTPNFILVKNCWSLGLVIEQDNLKVAIIFMAVSCKCSIISCWTLHQLTLAWTISLDSFWKIWLSDLLMISYMIMMNTALHFTVCIIAINNCQKKHLDDKQQRNMQKSPLCYSQDLVFWDM